MTAKKHQRQRNALLDHPKVEKLERDEDRCQWVCVEGSLSEPKGEAVLTDGSLTSMEDTIKVLVNGLIPRFASFPRLSCPTGLAITWT